MPEKKRTILNFQNATIPIGSGRSEGHAHLEGPIYSGELALVRLGRNERGKDLINACCGLSQLQGGEISFLGYDWSTLSREQCNAMRALIGYVFRESLWMNHLTVMENLALSSIYHSHRPVNDVYTESSRLCRMFGLPGAPTLRPEHVDEYDLRRAAVVRAFVGKPQLILLDEPTHGGAYDIIAPLVNAIRQARAHGAAAIWFTRDDRIWKETNFEVSRRFRFIAQRLMEARTS